MVHMTTTQTIPEGYTIRKADERDVYDPYADVPMAIRKPYQMPPKPHGWIVEHADFDGGQPVVTRKAGLELIERHRHGFWWTRCEDFAADIDLDFAAAPVAGIAALVEATARVCGLTTADFIELDERPGQFTVNGRSYGAHGSHWARNLRVTRNNADARLFDILRENSTR